MKATKLRTRFAPSPTGYMHVGNLRTALYAYLLAKAHGGDFILRIEDTDRSRQVEGATDIIYATLRETGLLWDEGPDKGGEFGPYIQSQRLGIYKKYAEQLVESGHAYRCFCFKHAQEEDEAAFTREEDPCRNLDGMEISKRLERGAGFVIRQKMPTQGATRFTDLVFGEIEIDNAELEDQVLIKSDGMPTYNFANVIDDHLMGITHVIRGNEYLSSTPKYNLLYKALGWDTPEYIHCAPVMKNATEKLSKRNGDASYQDLAAKGYLPGAVINYIAMLGWSPGGEEEIFDLEGLIGAFSVAGISRSPAVFDPLKLRHINAEHIRHLSAEQFHELALPWIRQGVKREDLDTKLLAELLHPRCEVLSDIPAQLPFLDELPEYDLALFENKKMKTNAETALVSLKQAVDLLAELPDYSVPSLHDALMALIAELGVKNGHLLWPLRIAVAGQAVTPGGAIELCALLGRDETVRRIHIAIKKLS